MRKFTAFLLALIMLVLFAACDSKDNGETTTGDVQTTEKANDKNPASNKEDESGKLLLTLYNADSDEYHALQGRIETIDTGIEAEYGMKAFRFVSPKNGVKVRLEGVMWSPIVDAFESNYVYLEVETEKDKIYEFECSVTETIPDFRLVAEYGEMKSTYYMAMDGESVKNVIEMTSIDYIPEEITDDSVFYNLCVARAASKIYYDGFVEHNDPAVIWNTVAYAVTLNYAELNGENYDEPIGLTTWEIEAYMDSMYPECKDAYPQMTEECHVEGSIRQNSNYDVTPCLFERFCTNEFYGAEDNGNGTYSVKIRIDDYRFEGYQEFGLAVIVKPDANSPFGYVITDVVDCKLAVG